MNGGTKLQSFLMITIFILGIACTVAAGRTIYVDSDATGLNDGSSWENAYNFLQDALADSNSSLKPVEIRVAQGNYRPDEDNKHPDGTGEREATFQLINGVTIKGGYAGFGQPDPNARDIEEHETILSGDLDGNDVDVNDPCDLLGEPTRFENSFHVITGTGTDETAILDGFTITGGNANGSERQNKRGGGMYNTNSGVTVLSCTFKWNFSLGWGGGIYNSNSRPKLTKCIFIGNLRSGMYNFESTLILTRCTFSRNLTPYYGGGIFNDFGTQITLIECIFTCNNSYGHGGGIFNNYGSLNSELTNCMFVGNHCEDAGGAIFNALSDLTLISCTFFSNSAGNEGGGLFIPPLPAPSVSSSNTDYYGYSIITNCIFWDNLPEQIVNLGGVISVVYSDIQGNWRGTGNIDKDPCFASSGYWADKNDPNIVVEPNDPNAIWIEGDYHLKSQAGRWDANEGRWTIDDKTSPCIDAGDPMSPIGDEPFPNGGIINMGAYGGTAEASKSYFGEPVCEKIVSGDINGDCKVNFLDFRLMAFHWLEAAPTVNSNVIVEDGIECYVQTSKSVYTLGENVEMLFRVTNLTGEEVLIPCGRAHEFNLLVQKDGQTIWMKVKGWVGFSPGVEILDGESVERGHNWNMKDNNDNLVEPGVYNVVGIIYGPLTEVKVAITIIP